jgi:hypothetical protein
MRMLLWVILSLSLALALLISFATFPCKGYIDEGFV